MLQTGKISPKFQFIPKSPLRNPLKLYYKAKDGTEIPVDAPDAQKLLREANNRYWDAVKTQRTWTPDLPLKPKKIF